MATINLKTEKAKFFQAKPSTFITIDDGDGNSFLWEIKNGGSVLQFEMLRLGEELRALDFGNLKTDDPKVNEQAMDKFKDIIDRFRSAYLQTIVCKSDPDTPAVFFDQNLGNLEFLIKMIGEFIKQAKPKEIK